MEGEGNKTWLYVGIGCGALALIGACVLGSCVACAGAGIGSIVVATEEPAEAVRSFFGHVRVGQLDRAYGEMSSGYQASHTLEQFSADVSAMTQLVSSTDQTISNRNIDGGRGTAEMGGTLEGGGATSFDVELLQESGQWRVTAVSVGGRTL